MSDVSLMPSIARLASAQVFDGGDDGRRAGTGTGGGGTGGIGGDSRADGTAFTRGRASGTAEPTALTAPRSVLAALDFNAGNSSSRRSRSMAL